MSKKFLVALMLLSACSSSKKLDYKVVDFSSKDKPVWIENLEKFEKNKGSKEYKYFTSEGESLDKRLCLKSANANANLEIAREINNEISGLYNSLKEEDAESLLTNYKKEEVNSLAKANLTGVESVEKYWEKRNYSIGLGAPTDKTNFYCYELLRVEKKKHDTIINKIIEKQLKNIANQENKKEIAENLENNAKKQNVNLDL
jgi:hypothetical protein